MKYKIKCSLTGKTEVVEVSSFFSQKNPKGPTIHYAKIKKGDQESVVLVDKLIPITD